MNDLEFVLNTLDKLSTTDLKISQLIDFYAEERKRIREVVKYVMAIRFPEKKKTKKLTPKQARDQIAIEEFEKRLASLDLHTPREPLFQNIVVYDIDDYQRHY